MRITEDQFVKQMRTAESHFGVKNLNHDRYYEKIRNFDPSVVAEAINSIVDTAPPLLSRFPTPVALLMACKDASARRDSDNKPKAYGCSAEGCDNGFISFYRFLHNRRTRASGPCATCFPSHAYPQIVIVDHAVAHACRREGKSYKADLTSIKYIQNSQYLNEDQFVEHLERGMHRVPGEIVAIAKPKPKQPQAQSIQVDPAMVKAQAQEVLENIVGEATI